MAHRCLQPVVQTCTERGTFSISFDDGTQPPQEAITQIFEQHDAKTTYFVNGEQPSCQFCNGGLADPDHRLS